jgi:hypothetical protein
MKANRPGQALIAGVKPAADEIANHGKECIASAQARLARGAVAG